MSRTVLIAALASTVMVLATATTRAAVIINAVESGGNVVVSGGGTLNLAALSLDDATSSLQGQVRPQLAELELGAAPATLAPVDLYGFFSVSGPTQFGTGGLTVADAGTGDRFGVANIPGVDLALIVPRGYTSGDPLSGA